MFTLYGTPETRSWRRLSDQGLSPWPLATLTYLEGNPTVVWIFRRWYKNFFRFASFLSALPAHLVCAHAGGGRSHPSHFPRVLVHPEVCWGKRAGCEAACQRGGRGLRLTAKGGGKVLHLVSFNFPWIVFDHPPAPRTSPQCQQCLAI